MDTVDRYDTFARERLWPGFDPSAIPLVMTDGTRTFLAHHERPPAGFDRMDGERELWVLDSVYATLRANSAIDVNGVITAGVLIPDGETAPEEVAALGIHEAFHVYQEQAHPEWTANEVELFTYPVESVDILARRRLETGALRRALGAPDSTRALCWSQAFLRVRADRFRRLSPGARAYERGLEVREGLAQYVESRAVGRGPPALPDAGYPPEAVRSRAYHTGHGLAVLLDEVSPGWQEGFDNDSGASLDGWLRNAVGGLRTRRCGPTPDEVGRTRAIAQRDIRELGRTLARRRAELDTLPGWRLVVEAAGSPVFPNRFDPLNVLRIGRVDVVHSRWLLAAGDAAEIEVQNRDVLTSGAGPHPLFNGIVRLIVPGLIPAPQVVTSGDTTRVTADGLRAVFIGAEVQGDDESKRLTVRLRR